MSGQLSILNQHYKVLPGSQSLHNLIKWDRDVCALDFLDDGERRRYSYPELRKCILSAASLIQTSWMTQDYEYRRLNHIIPVLLPQCPGLYITILAILEVGAAFCPISLDAPLERIKFVVEDVHATVVVTSREYKHLFEWQGGPNVVLIDDTPEIPGKRDDIKPDHSPATPPQDLAYVMYTSGSSGAPKGVAISHLAVTQSLFAHDKHIPSFSRFLQFASPSFDVSVFEIFFPLFRGVTLVGCRRPQMLNNLSSIIEKLEVDAVELTPTVVSSLIQHRSHVPSLKLLMTIGEMLTRPVIESFGTSKEQDGILYAMYGPTEAAIHCTINPRMKTSTKAANVGVPFDTVSAFIVSLSETFNRDLEISILPNGAVGELVLGGTQLADKYLNRMEQNEAVFVTIAGQRAYRTGDKARITPSGEIEILGRISSGQVKIRGQRVELGEIEDAIYRHHHVKTAAVYVLDSILVAFLLTSDLTLTVEEVVKACSAWLPSFMVPDEILILDSFPYLPSGKVDKRKLEAEFRRQRILGNDEVVRWSSPMERLIGEVIRDLLGVIVSDRARLAVYGLDSLVAIRMSSVLRSVGYSISPIEILKADDMCSLVRSCEKSHSGQISVTPSTIRIRSLLDDAAVQQAFGTANLEIEEIQSAIPCTPIQDAMLAETAVDNVAYKNQIVLALSPNFHPTEIIEAIQELVKSNSILRTGFIVSPNDKSIFLQVMWHSLLPSQFTILEDLSSDVDSLEQLSILHPFHAVISDCKDHTQVVLSLHHALYDAWSLELILDDLETILSGKALKARPQFDGVVEEHYTTSLVDDGLSSASYWKDHLSQFYFVPLPQFHAVKNVKQELSITGRKLSITQCNLESTARGLGVSPQSLFQAAYALLLRAYLGTNDICFGTVFSGRTSSTFGIEDVIGPCLSTLPVRIDLTTVSSVGNLVKQLNSINRKHLEHDMVPLRDIKKDCGVEPGQKIFDSLLVWQQTLHENNQQRNHVKLIDSSDYLEFDLTLEIIPSMGDIRVKVNYQLSIFPLAQIDILLQQLDQLVTIIAQIPETRLPALNVLLTDDILSIENVNPITELLPGSLTSSVESIAVKDPNRVAIEFASCIGVDKLDVTEITYAELNSQANQIAHYLIAEKILPDELVCVCLEKSTQLYISILAICKAGAGYVPVTPDTPKERLRKIISDSNVKLILSHSSIDTYLGSLWSSRILFVDKLNMLPLSLENPGLRFQPNNTAYCVFTSGSTGTPKGVLVTQGNLLSNLQVLASLYPHTVQSKLLQSCSQAFDVSVFEIFFTWHVGACLCTAVKDIMFRDVELAIRALHITHLSLTPTVAALIDPKNVPEVEFLVTAGEAVTAKVFSAWASHGLNQGYGPSETTNICTVRQNVRKDHTIDNIGPPLKNTSVFVLSAGDQFSIIPRGGEGELCFGGKQVARGYLDTHQNIGKFIQHPKYGLLYRSGDYGRLLPDGSLTFTGRKDDQVKLRGQRVELGEINSVLLNSSEVTDCITLIVEGDSQTDQRLVCFWTPVWKQGSEFECLIPVSSTIQELFTMLMNAVPLYMIPSALIPVSCLPSTTQGKVDRRLLINQYRSLSLEYLNQVSDTKKVHPQRDWTQLEEKIVKAVAKITNVALAEIKPDTSFFSMGIDSVSAIPLARALFDDVEVYAEISDILKNPTVSRLASRMSQVAHPRSKDALSGSLDFGFDPSFLVTTTETFNNVGRKIEHILPCTPLQEAMLAAAENASADMYNNRLVLEIKVSKGELQRVFAEMAGRHEILRTCFIKTSHPRFAFAQVILKDFTPEWEVTNSFDENSMLETHSPIPGRTDFTPPYNLCFSQSANASRLILSMHHAIYDGFALSVLLEEIELALEDLKLPPRVSFVPFVKYMSSLNLKDADTYWAKLLDDFHPVKIVQAGQFAESKEPERIQTSVISSQSECQLSWLESQAKSYEMSLLPVIQTIWASILSSRLNEVDVCFGNVVSGRTVPVDNVDRLVAPCFNTIPVRVKDMVNLSFLQGFRVLQSQNINCLPFQLTPLRRIQSRLADGLRLFDTLLILQPPARQLNSEIWSIVKESGAMDLPVVIEVIPDPDAEKLRLVLHTHCNYISNNEAAELLKDFDVILKKALQNPRHLIVSQPSSTLMGGPQLIFPSKSESRAKEQLRPDDSNSMNEMEKMIHETMAKFTDIPQTQINRYTTIHRLGLDSINALQIATDLRKQGYNIMGSDVLQHPSIAQLAIFLDETKKLPRTQIGAYSFTDFDEKYRESICTRLKIPSDSIEAIRPCTPVQCGMLAQTMHTDGQEYINSLCLELSPELSIEKFYSAWRASMKRYEMLRTGFIEIDDAKSPFAMVTYKEEVLPLPWTEREDSDLYVTSSGNDPSLILQSLSHSPWTLELIVEESTALVRFTAHHAIYDAQSLNLILRDVARNYATEINNSSLERISITPVLEAILKSNDCNETLRKKFWQQKNKVCINRFPDLTPLRISTTKSNAREKTSSLSIAQLENICKKQDVSIQAAGQVAWARLLYSYIGESSVTFGSTLSGRAIINNAEKYAFPTIVTIPISCEVTGTNSELLSKTMQWNSQMHEHQFTPLTSIQKWVGHPGGKLFDTLFTYQKYIATNGEIQYPWKIVREEASADYAVSMEVQPLENGDVQLRLTSKENIVPPEQAELILGQYEELLLDTLLNAAGSSTAVPLHRVDLVSISPAAEPNLPSPVELMHDFVEMQAKHTPQKCALEFTTSYSKGNFNTNSWTFEQINSESNKIAHLLISHGAKNADIIAICFDKCPEASFAILGIMRAGCAYVALDPSAPPDRLQFIVGDTQSSLILSTGGVAPKVSKIFPKSPNDDNKPEILDLGQPGLLKGFSTAKPILARPVNPRDTCYCLYTSGTTGTPKGCEITHESAVQAMMSFQRLFKGHWTAESKWLQFASFHFDVSVLEQFWSWSVGICVASAPRDLIFEDIPGMIRSLGITHIDLTPSLARLLHPKDVPSLTRGIFITGGEQLRQEILDAWGDYKCIYNGYGPTEATIGVTMYLRVPKNGKPSNIGPQFPNVGSYVFKLGTTEPVLRGGIGELCISGKLVGKGYLNRPELTEKHFPHLDDFGERVYRTGDLVRILHDGSFLFLGRADDQVKLRGQRLELSEINEVIKKESRGVQDVVTLVLKHNGKQTEQLVTFFVPSAMGVTPESSADLIAILRDTCESRLPGYMIPTYFIALERLPLSANNKADVKDLAKVFNSMTMSDLQSLGSGRNVNKTWKAKEMAVLTALVNFTSIELVTLQNSLNIYELGIDSISIIGLVRHLQREGFENATLSVVMKNTSISSLVRILASEGNENDDEGNEYLAISQQIAAFAHKHRLAAANELGIEASDIDILAPCTPAQEGMIFRFLGSKDTPYFTTFDFVLKDWVQEDRLREAWRRAISRLEMLRTKFVHTSDGYVQVVLKNADLDWHSGLLEDTRERSVPQSLHQQENELYTTEKILALSNPYKVSLVRNGESRKMSLRIFHGLYDGISLSLLILKICEEYHDHLDIDYGPSFHQVLPYGPLLFPKNAEAFWRNILKDHIYHPMPRIHNPSSHLMDKTISIVETITANEVQHLLALRTSLGITHQTIFLGLWSSTLASFLQPHSSSKCAVTLGLILSGRSFSVPSQSISSNHNLQNIIGPLFNTVPFHITISEGMCWTDLLRNTHTFCTQVIADGLVHTPLKDIIRWCGDSGNINESAGVQRRELFDTLFVFQHEASLDPIMEGESALWESIPRQAVADYPLALEVQLNRNGDIVLTLVALKEYMDNETAAEILANFKRALRDLRSPEKATSRRGATDSTPTYKYDKVQTETSPPAQSHSRNNVFKWTPEARCMKAEIESLAGVDDINEHSSIFALGLDSIDIIKLVSRLRMRGIHIPVSAVVNYQTIAKMIEKISNFTSLPKKPMINMGDQERKLTNYLRETRRLPEDAIRVLPTTPLQEGMFAEMLTSDYTKYLNHEIFHVASHVDIQNLKDAWNSVMVRNDILRTRFVEVDDVDLSMSYVQVVVRPAANYWHDIDVSQHASLQDKFEAIRNTAILIARGGELVHLNCIKHGKEQYFVLSIAHALYDGWSMQALHQDVWRAYNGEFVTRPDLIPTLELILNANGTEAEKFWKASVTGLRTSMFSSRLGQDNNSKGMVHRYDLPSSHPIDKIRAFCRSNSISLQTLGQTCWAMLLAAHLKKLDVVFGVVFSCRDTEESDELMFPLMNTIAIRSVIHGSVFEMLQYMQENGNSVRKYQHFPLRKIQVLRGLYDESLFDSLFIYQGHAIASISENERLYKSVESVAEVDFAVCMEMEIIDEELVWHTSCKDSVLTAAATKTLLSRLDGLFGAIMKDTKAPVISSNSDGISICGLPRFLLNESRAAARDANAAAHSQEIPWTGTEMRIREVLSLVSKIPKEQIDKYQTIFHLGLDSISAVKVSSILRREDIRLSVSDIMKHKTICNMAKIVEQGYNDSMKEELDVEETLARSIKSVDREDILRKAGVDLENCEDVLPVTAGQLYMITRWHESCGALFVGTFSHRVATSFHKGRLEKAWKILLKRHPILRTLFVVIGDGDPLVVQVVLKELENNIGWSCASGVDKQISLGLPLLLNAETHKDSSILCLQIHHALYDGVSLPLILQELQFLYNTPSDDVIPNTDFRRFVARSCNSQSKILHRRMDFWISYLSASTLLRPRHVSVPDLYKRVEVFEPGNSIENVALISQKNGVSIDAILLAAFSKIYRRLLDGEYDTISQESAPEDVVFGLYLANRAVYGEDLSNLIAPTLNLLPIHISSIGSLSQIAHRVQSDLQKLSKSDIAVTSLAEIQEWTGVRVNCFVNILKQPDHNDVDDTAVKSVSTLPQFLETCGDGRRPRAEIVDLKYDSSLRNVLKERSSKFYEAYLPSVDIELRVTGSGNSLDIGVFAPWEYMDVEDARRVVEGIKTQLSGIE